MVNWSRPFAASPWTQLRVIATIRKANEGTFHYDVGRSVSDRARSMLPDSGKATVRVGDAQVLGPELEVGPATLSLVFDPVCGNLDHRITAATPAENALSLTTTRLASEMCTKRRFSRAMGAWACAIISRPVLAK